MLKLNWNLTTREERRDFVSNYLKDLHNPSSEDLDMMAKYILWGKTSLGTSISEDGIELETAHGTWKKSREESLDSLLESPTFNEAELRSSTSTPYRIPAQKFSRSEARRKAPPSILLTLESLWSQIDNIEVTLNFYDQRHGRRSSDPRPQLIARLTESELEAARQKSSALNFYGYLKLKHLLVELRQQQYMLKDLYQETSAPQVSHIPNEDIELFWGEDIIVLPLGLVSTSSWSQKLFNKERMPAPSDFSEAELTKISHALWGTLSPQTPAADLSQKLVFDFRKIEDLKKLVDIRDEFEDFGIDDTMTSNAQALFHTFDAYAAMSDLKPFHYRILEFKQKHKTNQEILDMLQTEFGIKYGVNYISTLYYQTILKEIAKTAQFHREIAENLFFQENFKTCLDCGRPLLLDERNFMRKIRVKDGFDCRCKKCAKIKRDLRKARKGDKNEIKTNK